MKYQFGNEITKFFYVLLYFNGSVFVISQFHIIIIWIVRFSEGKQESARMKIFFGEHFQ